jgi:hypothetical protein
MRTLLLAATLLALAAPSAFALFEPKTRHVNLDGDAKAETVRTVKVPGPNGETDDLAAGTEVAIQDDCGSIPVTGPQDALGHLSFPKADTHPGREVLVDLRSGASGRAGSIDLVGWRRRASGCARPRTLFHYSSGQRVRAPRGAEDKAGFGARVRDLTSRFAGKELALSVYFTKPGDALCCPSFHKTILYRYDRHRDVYRRYAARTKRLA